MFETLAALLFGATYTGAWTAENIRENKRRDSARNDNISFYYDKKGIMRHVENGRKYTTEEVHKLFHGNKDELKRQREQEYEDLIDRKYYAVLNPYKILTQEVFLTYEEAVEYINKCKQDGKEVEDEPWKICKVMWQSKHFKFNLHFEEERK